MLSCCLFAASASYKGDVAIFGDRHYSFVHVGEGREKVTGVGSYCNLQEALIIVRLVGELHDNHIKGCVRNELQTWDSPERVRIITFYNGQVFLIQHLLKKANLPGITVATVDSSQGSEADVVIVSFVRSKGVNERHSVGFLTDNRRLNVALTRAKYQLICVGNVYGSLHLEKRGAIKELVQNTIERGHVVQLNKNGKFEQVARDCRGGAQKCQTGKSRNGQGSVDKKRMMTSYESGRLTKRN